MTREVFRSATRPGHVIRIRLQVRGVVQGVGFRPFVHRLARHMGLAGWVLNGPEGVTIEVEGPGKKVSAFPGMLLADRPPHAHIQGMEQMQITVKGETGFDIRPSLEGDRPTTWILPDIATCPECMKDITDPKNRRYRYPFTNCTNCGPRFTIIRSLPYDRPNTSMAGFAMCPRCREEYNDPTDRRFHAQPNACPDCGPKLSLVAPDGTVLAERDHAMRQAVAAVRSGHILAVKGLGGFHLLTNATNRDSTTRLRRRKRRGNKPFAVMVPNLETAQALCRISHEEIRWLTAPEAPIVLLQRIPGPEQLPDVAPNNPYLGVMLPYTPLHAILLSDLGIPVVATSGNVADEPICTRATEAMKRLSGIADLFLLHDRPILRPVDDSIVRVMADHPVVIRRSRGFAPWPVELPGAPDGVIAVGAHLKNTCACSVNGQVFISQHIGDLETPPAREALRHTLRDLPSLYQQEPKVVAHDLHPDYASTLEAKRLEIPAVPIQHHLSHVLSCMAENAISPPVIGVAWDGTGMGTDGMIWGGETFVVEQNAARRTASLLPFPLPGGQAAVKEPRRTAAGLLTVMGLDPFTDPVIGTLFTKPESDNLRIMLTRGLQTPLTTSAGRLFDAVSALLGLSHINSFEAEAAMLLEFEALRSTDTGSYPVDTIMATNKDPIRLDWRGLVQQILADRDAGVPVPDIALRFHRSLARAIGQTADSLAPEAVCLSGGCFQNTLLLSLTAAELEKRGKKPFRHQRIPPNDGGVSLGQLAGATVYRVPLKDKRM